MSNTRKRWEKATDKALGAAKVDRLKPNDRPIAYLAYHAAHYSYVLTLIALGVAASALTIAIIGAAPVSASPEHGNGWGYLWPIGALIVGLLAAAIIAGNRLAGHRAAAAVLAARAAPERIGPLKVHYPKTVDSDAAASKSDTPK